MRTSRASYAKRSTASSPGVAVLVPDPQRSRAVLIGSSTYDDEDLPDLPVITKTVEDLATASH